MQKFTNKILIACLGLIIFSSLVLNPGYNMAADASITTKEQLQQTITSAFDNYLNARHITINNSFPEDQFQAFLRQNPQYVDVLGRYLNLTEQENFEKFLEIMPDIAGATPVKEGPIFKTRTQAIDGSNVTVDFNNVILSNGVNLTKVTCHCAGVDPNIYVMRVTNTLPYWGVDLPCGYSDYMGVYIEPGTNTFQWLSQVNSWADNHNDANTVETGIFGLLSGIAIPPGKVFGIAGFALGWATGEYTGTGFDAVRDKMVSPSSNHPTWGLNWCLQNTYQYYPNEWGGYTYMGWQGYFVRNWSVQGYPFEPVTGLTIDFHDLFFYGSVLNAMAIDDAIDTFGKSYSWNEWYQITYDQMPKILDPPAPVTISIVGVDDVTGQNVYDEAWAWDWVPIYIDDNYVGNLGYTPIVTVPIDPGNHTITVGDSFTYGYTECGRFYATYSYMDFIGHTDTNNPAAFSLLDPISIVIHYNGGNFEYYQ